MQASKTETENAMPNFPCAHEQPCEGLQILRDFLDEYGVVVKVLHCCWTIHGWWTLVYMLEKTNLVMQDFKVLRNLGARAKHWGDVSIDISLEELNVCQRGSSDSVFAAGNCMLELLIERACYTVNGKDKIHNSKTVNGPSLQTWYQVSGGFSSQSFIEYHHP
jgi:hypothetical protein